MSCKSAVIVAKRRKGWAPASIQRPFHEAFLAIGSVPLPVLEQRMAQFIADGGVKAPGGAGRNLEAAQRGPTMRHVLSGFADGVNSPTCETTSPRMVHAASVPLVVCCQNTSGLASQFVSPTDCSTQPASGIDAIGRDCSRTEPTMIHTFTARV